MPKIKTAIKVIKVNGNTGTNFGDSLEKRDDWELPWRLYGVRCVSLLLQVTAQKFLLEARFTQRTELVVLCLGYQLPPCQDHKS
jgi:hypothetical protein